MAKIKLTSYGASSEVTGSCHLLNIDGYRLLVDCGLWQGSPENYLKNWQAFDFHADEIDAVILTHSHLDHCGRLPLLYQQGYRGQIYGTAATTELADVVLADNLNILREKATQLKLRPLYSEKDLLRVKQRWQAVPYYHRQALNNDISFTLHNAGHILGAAIVEIKVKDKTLVFSGDLGAKDMPLVKNVDYLEKASYIIMESTYGDREHEHVKNRNQKLLDAIRRVTLNNSTLVISVFAIERTQDVLKVLNDYYETHLDFRVPVYLDSPMAAQATKVYKKHLDLLNDEARDWLRRDHDIFNFPHLKITTSTRLSKTLNSAPSPKIILAGSGMAEGGRIIHHLARYLPEAKNQVLFLGFQVPGTLGHYLLNGAFNFDYFGRRIPIKAAINQIDGFSAHADQSTLLEWLSHFQGHPKIYLVHGDAKVMTVLKDKIIHTLGHQTELMPLRQTIELK